MSALPSTRFTRRFGIAHPIVQGPMGGGSSTPALVAAVSGAGGLGSLGAYHLTPNEIRASVAEIRTLTDRPFALNLWVPRELPAPTLADIPPERLEAAREVARPLRRELGLSDEWELPSVERPDF